MSTPAGPPHTFFVYAPDSRAPGTLERRMAVRAQHLARAAELIHAGVIRVGGGLLTPESIAPGATAADLRLVGSGMVVAAASLAAVRALIEEDVYYTSGVWDAERLVVLPILLASGPTP